jgi:hypothetical protein
MESFTLQNTGRGQIAFMLNPPVHMEDGMPKHKRRKALRENVQSIVIPQAGSVDLVEKTGLSVGVLRQLPEVLTILRNPNVRWMEDPAGALSPPPPVETKPEPPAPPPPVVEKVPEPVREAVVPPPPAPPVEEPKPAPEPEKVPEAPPVAMPAGLPPGAAPAAPEPVRTGKVKGGKNTAKGNSKP